MRSVLRASDDGASLPASRLLLPCRRGQASALWACFPISEMDTILVSTLLGGPPRFRGEVQWAVRSQRDWMRPFFFQKQTRLIALTADTTSLGRPARGRCLGGGEGQVDLVLLLRVIALRRWCVFHKLKVCGNPAPSKFIGTIFPTAFAHFLSLCRILVTPAILQTFSLLLFSVMVTCEQSSLMFLLQKDHDWKTQMTASIF